MGIGIGLIAAAQLRQEARAVAAGRQLLRFGDQAVIARPARLPAEPFDGAARGGEAAHQRIARRVEMKHALLIAAGAQPVIEDGPVIGEDQALRGAHAVEQDARRIGVGGDRADDMIMPAGRNGKPFRQSGLGRAGLVNAPHHRAIADERREKAGDRCRACAAGRSPMRRARGRAHWCARRA